MKGKSKPCMCEKNMQTSHRNAQNGFTNILLLLVMLIYFYTHMAVFPDIPGIKIRLLLFCFSIIVRVIESSLCSYIVGNDMAPSTES